MISKQRQKKKNTWIVHASIIFPQPSLLISFKNHMLACYWCHPWACRGGHMGATAGEKDGDDAIILTSKYENEEPFILTLALMV